MTGVQDGHWGGAASPADLTRTGQGTAVGHGEGEVDELTRGVFRELANHIAKGVVIVSARHRGLDYATTVTDVLSVSWDPPTLLVSLYSLGRMAEAVEASGTWGVSVLTAGQRPVADWLAEPGTPLVGLLDQVPHLRRDPEGPALIEGASAWFEVRTTASVEVATHTLFAGEVAWMSAGTAGPPGPLVRYRSGYSALD